MGCSCLFSINGGHFSLGRSLYCDVLKYVDTSMHDLQILILKYIRLFNLLVLFTVPLGIDRSSGSRWIAY